ncbi:MAG: hypothetical protein IPH89_12205 [Bacteroidetes bacterium]|nr:hypothetical protein [Bacteroidota bacterium]
MKYNEDDILNDLDNNGGMENPYKFFPTLEDGYTNISSNKNSSFSQDQDRWAIVFEKSGYNNRGYQILKSLTYFETVLKISTVQDLTPNLLNKKF